MTYLQGNTLRNPDTISYTTGYMQSSKKDKMNENINIAVLIDGDNIPSANVKEMMEEIAKYGNPTLKRIYGDWTRP